MLFGGIEAGGTKFVCAVGDENGQIVEKIQLPSMEPQETLPEVIRFFQQYDLLALGLGSFGPIDVNPKSPTYGYITTTPKTDWQHYPIVQTLKVALNIPVCFTTDVNAAAFGEHMLGAARGLDSCLYMTVGTGIGAGAVVKGHILEGLSHPEMGHILVRRHPDDFYEGKCPYHRDCLEGMAAGPAIEERWGEKGIKLANRREVWELEAYYLSQAIMHYHLILSPKIMVLGGGVMQQKQLFPLIDHQFKQWLNGYLTSPVLSSQIEPYIVPPGLKGNSGIVGALLLGKQAYFRLTK